MLLLQNNFNIFSASIKKTYISTWCDLCMFPDWSNQQSLPALVTDIFINRNQTRTLTLLLYDNVLSVALIRHIRLVSQGRRQQVTQTTWTHW